MDWRCITLYVVLPIVNFDIKLNLIFAPNQFLLEFEPRAPWCRQLIHLPVNMLLSRCTNAYINAFFCGNAYTNAYTFYIHTYNIFVLQPVRIININ